MSEINQQPVFAGPGRDERDQMRAGPGWPAADGRPGAGSGPGGPGEPGGPGAHGGGRGAGGGPWWRRRPVLLAGASVGAAALVVAGLGAADAMGATVLSTSQVASRVDPGLVDVVSTLGYQDGEAAGTGMVLTSSGEVLTNNHVIDGATAIRATDIGNGRTYTAKVVGYDKTHDVAVLQLAGASGLRTVSLSSASPRAGQKVVALGNAGGKGGTPSVVTGTVNGLGQSITASDESSGSAEQLTGLIGTDAPIQPGDSGGPLVNVYGQVIGMDTAASSSASAVSYQSGQPSAQTQAFAIPVTEAAAIASQIEAGTPSATGHLGGTAFLGVQVSAGTSSGSDSGPGPGGLGGYGGGGYGGYGGYGGGYGGYGDGDGSYGGASGSSGAVVAGVVPGSAAGQAGLTAGDQITSVAGHAITSAPDIQPVLAHYHPGDKISISWTDQSGQSQTATVTLTAGPAA